MCDVCYVSVSLHLLCHLPLPLLPTVTSSPTSFTSGSCSSGSTLTTPTATPQSQTKTLSGTTSNILTTTTMPHHARNSSISSTFAPVTPNMNGETLQQRVESKQQAAGEKDLVFEKKTSDVLTSEENLPVAAPTGEVKLEDPQPKTVIAIDGDEVSDMDESGSSGDDVASSSMPSLLLDPSGLAPVDAFDEASMYGAQRRNRRRPRRATIELEAYERWQCPKGCGKVYRKNSTVSIRKHVPYCTGPPMPYGSQPMLNLPQQYPLPNQMNNNQSAFRPQMAYGSPQPQPNMFDHSQPQHQQQQPQQLQQSQSLQYAPSLPMLPQVPPPMMNSPQVMQMQSNMRQEQQRQLFQPMNGYMHQPMMLQQPPPPLQQQQGMMQQQPMQQPMQPTYSYPPQSQPPYMVQPQYHSSSSTHPMMHPLMPSHHMTPPPPIMHLLPSQNGLGPRASSYQDHLAALQAQQQEQLHLLQSQQMQMQQQMNQQSLQAQALQQPLHHTSPLHTLAELTTVPPSPSNSVSTGVQSNGSSAFKPIKKA